MPALARIGAAVGAYYKSSITNQKRLYARHQNYAKQLERTINVVGQLDADYLLRKRLTEPEKAALAERPWLRAAFLGTAVHREVAARLGRTWEYRLRWVRTSVTCGPGC